MKIHKILIASCILVLSSCNEDDSQTKTNSVLSTTNEVSMCMFELINSSDNPYSKPDAAIIEWPLWETGQIIKIKFLDGDPIAQEKVKKYAAIWTTYANLKFEYVSTTDYADIRIGFNVGKPGAWSDLGSNSTSYYPGYQNEPSMRLGPLNGSDESAQRTILHEFGHALGLIHETKNPAANINWNLPKVYKYYSDLMGWSQEETDEFVVGKYSPDKSNYSEYDPLSIMHYYIPPSLTNDGIGVNEMSNLSDTDMISINKWYPYPARSIIQSGERIDIIPWTQAIKSPNGNYRLQFSNTDGLLYIYNEINNKIIWQVGNPMYYYRSSCYLEPNGNLTIKGSHNGFGAPIHTTWSSNTSEFPGAKLQLQNDGNLVLTYNGVVKWSS